MVGLLRLFIFWGITFGAFGFIAYQIWKFYLTSGGRKSRQDADIKQLREQLTEYLEELVPLDVEELELISREQENIGNQLLLLSNAGITKSIYHEPLMAHAVKTYPESDYQILMACTADDEFLYIIDGDDAEVFVNNRKLGHLEDRNKLVSVDGSEVIAEIVGSPTTSSQTILVRGKDVGDINNETENIGQQSRAYKQLEVKDDRTKRQLLALTLPKLLLD